MKALVFLLTAVLLLAYTDAFLYQFDRGNCGAKDNKCDPEKVCLLARCVN